MIPRRRLVEAFSRSGVGVHTGAPGTVLVQPAPWNTGIRIASPGGHWVPAEIAHVRSMAGMTVVRSTEISVGMVEHLLAALYAHGVTDAVVVSFGPEIPILDGSALPWCEAIADVGLEKGPPISSIEVVKPVKLSFKDGWAQLTPCERCEVSVTVDFGPSLRGTAEVVLTPQRFETEVAWARTFAMERDVDALRAAGRGVGATLDNTVVLRDDGTVVNDEGMRHPDEFVRHKLLDAIGDLALLGAPLKGRFEVHRGSHALHHDVLRKFVLG